MFGEYLIKVVKKKEIREREGDGCIEGFKVNKVGVGRMGGMIMMVGIVIGWVLLGKLDKM